MLLTVAQRRDQRGITVVELLVALAVLSIAFGILVSVLTSSAQANRVTAERVAIAEASQLASQILVYHVRLAGYVGASPDNRVGTVCGASVEIGPDGSSVTVRYFEDRLYGAETATNDFVCNTGDVVTHVTFSSDGNAMLQNGQPAVAGVTALEVVEYFVSGAGSSSVFPIPPATLPLVSGLTLRLTFVDASTRDVLVSLVNPQRLFFDAELPIEESEVAQ